MERFVRSALGTTLALVLTLICGSVRHASASVVYVNKTATGSVHDGKTWATAFTFVSHALVAATSGDEIWVAEGLYRETTFGLRAGVPVYGGFAGTEAVRGQRDGKLHPTVLDGCALCSGFPAGSEFTLDSLKLRATGNPYAPGLVSAYDGSKVTLTNCAFNVKASRATPFYGFAGRNASAVISGCTFSGGPESGCGIRLETGSTATVTNSVFTDSQIGIEVFGGTLDASNSVLSRNAGGISVGAGGSATVTNCTITENINSAIFVDTGVAVVTNSIVAYNGKGLDGAKPGLMVLSHNDVYGSYISNYSVISDPTGTDGNIGSDPKLANRYHNFHIQPDSPCVDAGTDSAVQGGSTDFDGQPRILGAHVDIGADESDGTTWTVPSLVWHVSPTGADAADGLTWSTAKKTIGGAIAVAQGMDEVWVAKGTYAENLTLPAGVALYGGFSGAESTRSLRDWDTNVTVLDGLGSTQDAVTSAFAGAVLDGFAVRNGKNGVNAVSGDATISNCTFAGNSNSGISSLVPIAVSNCTVRGNYYGIYARGSNTTIAGCVIAGNPQSGVDVAGAAAHIADTTLSGNGDGIIANGGAITVTHCALSGNANAGFTGDSSLAMSNCVVVGGVDGVYANGTRTIITNCVFDGSTEYAVFVWRGLLSVSNSTFTRNSNAIYVAAGQAITVTNCILAYNDGIGMYVPNSGDKIFRFLHNDVINNRQGNWINFKPVYGQGNISYDPLFANRLAGDYHLRLRSPCIDTGDDSVITPGETDLDGRPRIQRSHVDMGCYEFPGVVKYTPTQATGGIGG